MSSPQTHLAAVLGHELRNPLAGAVAGVAAAAELTEAGDPRRKLLERALDELDRTAVTLDRYLDLGSGREPRRESTDLVALARDTVRRWDAVVVPSAARVVAEVDPVLLRQALDNLLQNARQAGAASVEIQVDIDRGRPVLIVIDDGPGIPAELREQVMTPFVSGRGGTGLGLALVGEIVDAHGGSVTIEPGEPGTRVRLQL
ncbi:MAG: HAMP domain-containing sensor histidine kinase [Planctomycetota bacterium]